MRKILLGVVPMFITFMGQLQADLQTDINRAASMLSDFQIPDHILRNAKGVVTMKVLKGGFIFSGRIGSGLVVANLKDKWSAPSALGIGGAGWGWQIGGKVTDFVLVLNTQAALEAFSGGGNVTLGGSLSVAAGPIGRTGEGAIGLPPAAMFYYGRSKGLFGGASLEGTIIAARNGANQTFYKRPVSPRELLSGNVPPPDSAKNLYRQLP